MRDDREKDTPSDGTAAYALLIVIGAVIGILIAVWILWRIAHLKNAGRGRSSGRGLFAALKPACV